MTKWRTLSKVLISLFATSASTPALIRSQLRIMAGESVRSTIFWGFGTESRSRQMWSDLDPQKTTFGELGASDVRDVLIYCRDHRSRVDAVVGPHRGLATTSTMMMTAATNGVSAVGADGQAQEIDE
jgi:hypothetical protein